MTPAKYVTIRKVERLRREVGMADDQLQWARDQDAPRDELERIEDRLDGLLEELTDVEDSEDYEHERAHLAGDVDKRLCQGIGCPYGDH